MIYRCPCQKLFDTDSGFQEHIKGCQDFQDFLKTTIQIVEESEKLEKTYDRPGDYI